MTLRNFGIYSSRNLNIFQSFFILLKEITNMKKVESIIDFGGGEIVDRINFEMAKVIENINNPNTDEKPRKLTIEVKLKQILKSITQKHLQLKLKREQLLLLAN